MDAVLAIIDAMAPCIVIVEEIEKALAGVGGTATDGGTTQRVGAKFLTWLQDHQSEVFICATCNDIKSLSAASAGAFVRIGRWDAIFFQDLPNRQERREILAIYLREFLNKGLEDFERLPDLAGYSGAEIKQVCIEAAYSGGDLEQAVNFVIPLSKTNKDQIDELRKWAEGRTIPASLPEPEITEPGTAAPALREFSRLVQWE
jgi:SpoVK/Ycf46/Vps4 family AAA+-type ATPase